MSCVKKHILDPDSDFWPVPDSMNTVWIRNTASHSPRPLTNLVVSAVTTDLLFVGYVCCRAVRYFHCVFFLSLSRVLTTSA